MELSKRYKPAEVEAKNYRFWEEGNFFRPPSVSSTGIDSPSSSHRRTSPDASTWGMR